MLIPCTFLNDKSPVVFVGTVISPEDPETQVILHDSPVVFDVTERLRGDVGKQISIYEQRTPCDFAFRFGKSYLVSAYVYNGRLVTSQLTLTRPVSDAVGILRQLREIKQGQRAASVFGTLGGGDSTGAPRPMGPITLTATSKHRTLTTRSAEDGSFEFKDLPPGIYRIKAESPQGWRFLTDVRVKHGKSCDLDGMGQMTLLADK